MMQFFDQVADGPGRAVLGGFVSVTEKLSIQRGIEESRRCLYC